MFGIGKVLGSVVSALGDVFGAVVSHPKNALLVGAALVLLGSVGLTGYVIGADSAQTAKKERGSVTPLGDAEYPTSLSDWLTATAPSSALFSPPKEETKVDTVRIKVPKYIIRRDTVTTTRLGNISLNSAPLSAPSLSLETSLQSSKFKFLVLPTIKGKPAVSVNKDRTLIGAFDPRGASSVELRYKHPEEIWQFGPFVQGNMVFGGPNLEAKTNVGGWIRRKDIRLDVGYSLSTTPEFRGISTALEYSPDLSP